METGTKGKTYKIGQAAKLLEVKPFVLRFWESEFKDVLVPVRTPAGQRAYSEHNVATVREIKRLLYDEGLTIEGAKKRLGQPQGSATRAPIASPAPASPEQPAFASSTAMAESRQDLAPAPEAQARPARPEPQADAKADALRATLRDIKSELTRIRDILGG
jgi:DNA-binding transcriptional MerR regulator